MGSDQSLSGGSHPSAPESEGSRSIVSRSRTRASARFVSETRHRTLRPARTHRGRLRRRETRSCWCTAYVSSQARRTRSTSPTRARWWKYVPGTDSKHPGAGHHDPRPLEPSRCARRLGGRRGLCPLGGQGAPDRGGVGVRGAGRIGRCRVRVGVSSRPAAGTWPTRGRGVPDREPEARRVRVDGAGRLLPAERLRHPRHGGERLGVDGGLVPGARRDRARLLHDRQPARGDRDASYEPREADARPADPEEGDEGWIAPVCGELLPSLPAGRTDAPGRGHFDVAPRLPLRRARAGAGTSSNG